MKLIRDKYEKIIEPNLLYKESDEKTQFKFLVKKVHEELAELEETDFKFVVE